MRSQEQIAAWIGMDWADEAHEVCEYATEIGRKEQYRVEHGAESLQEWIQQLRMRYGGQVVAIVLEQARGGLIYALMSTDFIRIYPVNPQSLAQYRKALYPSGAKSDPPDAELLEEMVRQNSDRFRAWVPNDVPTRSLQLLTEARRKFVDNMTSLTNQLTSALKTYYPQALEWAGDLSSEQACAFLEKWPTLRDVKKSRPFRIREFYEKYGRPRHEVVKERVRQIQNAQPLTLDPAVVQAGVMMSQSLVKQIESLRAVIEKYDQEIERIFQQHPDRAVFESFPGAGKVLAPRLAAVFGADRDRYQAALQVEQLSGVAPVTERSGKRIWVHRRWACSKFVLQTFHEFADQARKFCLWSKLHYQDLRRRGKDHHAAVRALAYKWIRIIFRCWKDRVPYDDTLYVRSLFNRGSYLAADLSQAGCTAAVENPGEL
jgi:transposase